MSNNLPPGTTLADIDRAFGPDPTPRCVSCGEECHDVDCDGCCEPCSERTATEYRDAAQREGLLMPLLTPITLETMAQATRDHAAYLKHCEEKVEKDFERIAKQISVEK